MITLGAWCTLSGQISPFDTIVLLTRQKIFSTLQVNTIIYSQKHRYQKVFIQRYKLLVL